MVSLLHPAQSGGWQGRGLYQGADREDVPACRQGWQHASLTVSTRGWDPFYRFTEMRRTYYDPPRKDPNTGEMISYAGAEMHENKTQIYIVWRGTATMAMGGKPEKERPGPYYDGQHGGANKLIGATSTKVKPGDVIIIPPNTWHHALVDPGQTFSYHMCHIETRRLIP